LGQSYLSWRVLAALPPRSLLKWREARIVPWSGSIAGCFWLKEKHQETEQHPSVNTGSPCLSARGFTATHRGCHCSVNLMQRSLPFYLDHVTVLLAVRACWVCFGAILPVLECDGSSYSRRLLKGRSHFTFPGQQHQFHLLTFRGIYCLLYDAP